MWAAGAQAAEGGAPERPFPSAPFSPLSDDHATAQMGQVRGARALSWKGRVCVRGQGHAPASAVPRAGERASGGESEHAQRYLGEPSETDSAPPPPYAPVEVHLRS